MPSIHPFFRSWPPVFNCIDSVLLPCHDYFIGKGWGEKKWDTDGLSVPVLFEH